MNVLIGQEYIAKLCGCKFKVKLINMNNAELECINVNSCTHYGTISNGLYPFFIESFTNYFTLCNRPSHLPEWF